ncbi:hypothetical protein [Kangiella koreensis]|uniref:Uncharacterized protein n=1 Tax=Kangiella koreensis (strain DSM 16069 / JCM 12317 / KCTC 12182 / SW-125) TaxID=523791 RepID=C7R8X5_KANKD|nr:hypothetical protein [Kangiella koreensis]ACV25988.1 hypothetical protein Kkor_0568 [Kangiella koreensis DSM 16069]
MEIRTIALDSLRNKYPFLLGKSFFRTHSWLSLDIISALAIIGILTFVSLKTLPDYFYKVAFVEGLTNHLLESRERQQEYYAWHGHFEDTQYTNKPLVNAAQLPKFKELISTQGKTVMVMEPFYQYPESKLTITLDDTNNSVIRPICQIEHNETFHLMPYMCKLNYYEKR